MREREREMARAAHTKRGYLISFEGLDGAGKTTQVELLENWFSERDLPSVRTREPGGTDLGREIRRLLVDHAELTITPLAEAFLFQADRAQHFATLILPALERGTHVLTDRCFDSSIAYQGAGRQVGEELIEDFSLIATQGHMPDLTILLDLDPEKVQTRTDTGRDESGRREAQSRFDKETVTFHQRLRQSFQRLARAYPQRIKIIDALQPPAEIHHQVVRLVENLLRQER